MRKNPIRNYFLAIFIGTLLLKDLVPFIISNPFYLEKGSLWLVIVDVIIALGFVYLFAESIYYIYVSYFKRKSK